MDEFNKTKGADVIGAEISRLQGLRETLEPESIKWAKVNAQIQALFWAEYPDFTADKWLEA